MFNGYLEIYSSDKWIPCSNCETIPDLEDVMFYFPGAMPNLTAEAGLYCHYCYYNLLKNWFTKEVLTPLSVNQNYRARRIGKLGQISGQELWNKGNEQNWHCYYCHEPLNYFEYNLKYEIEHVVPLSGGGEHAINNIVFACHACNTKKGSLPYFVWAMKQFGLFDEWIARLPLAVIETIKKHHEHWLLP